MKYTHSVNWLLTKTSRQSLKATDLLMITDIVSGIVNDYDCLPIQRCKNVNYIKH